MTVYTVYNAIDGGLSALIVWYGFGLNRLWPWDVRGRRRDERRRTVA